MNKFLALSLLAFVVSCSSKSQPATTAGKPNKAAPTTDPAPTGQPPQTSDGLPGGGGTENAGSEGEVPLEGTWLQCQKSDPENSDYGSASAKTNFQAGNKLDVTAKYFLDAECKKPFDNAAAEKIRLSARKNAEAMLKAEPEIGEDIDSYMKEQVEPYIQALLNGDSSQLTYKISALNSLGIGEFDMTMSGMTMYYSYKKSGSQLWISEGCINGLEDFGFPGVDPGEEPIEEEEEEGVDNPTRDRDGGFGLTSKSVKKLSYKRPPRPGLGLSDIPVPVYCAESPKTRSDNFKDVSPLIKQ